MPEDITVGVKVLIISPSYVAGKVGVVYRRENLSSDQPSDRWLVQVDSEDLIVSLSPEEFQVLSSGEESL